MCDQTEVAYLPGDVVWVKLGPLWWPGKVIREDEISTDIIKQLRKPPIAIVKFFQEDTYEFVKNLSNVYHYNCLRKNEFIKKGLNVFRSNNRNMPANMKYFPEDIAAAEMLTDGNPDILNDSIFRPEEKTDYKDLFPSTKKTPKKTKVTTEPKKKDTPILSLSNKQRTVTHPRFIRSALGMKTDYEVKIRIQNSSKPDELKPSPSEYKCHACPYTTTRLNVLIEHNKTHLSTESNNCNGGKKVKEKSSASRSKLLDKSKIKLNRSYSKVSNEPTKRKQTETASPKKRMTVKDNSDKLGLDTRIQGKVKYSESRKSDRKSSDDNLPDVLLEDWMEYEDLEVTEENNAEWKSKNADVSKCSNDEAQNKMSCFDFDETDDNVIDNSQLYKRKIPRQISKIRTSSEEGSNLKNDDVSISPSSSSRKISTEYNASESEIDNDSCLQSDSIVPTQPPKKRIKIEHDRLKDTSISENSVENTEETDDVLDEIKKFNSEIEKISTSLENKVQECNELISEVPFTSVEDNVEELEEMPVSFENDLHNSDDGAVTLQLTKTFIQIDKSNETIENNVNEEDNEMQTKIINSDLVCNEIANVTTVQPNQESENALNKNSEIVENEETNDDIEAMTDCATIGSSVMEDNLTMDDVDTLSEDVLKCDEVHEDNSEDLVDNELKEEISSVEGTSGHLEPEQSNQFFLKVNSKSTESLTEQQLSCQTESNENDEIASYEEIDLTADDEVVVSDNEMVEDNVEVDLTEGTAVEEISIKNTETENQSEEEETSNDDEIVCKNVSADRNYREDVISDDGSDIEIIEGDITSPLEGNSNCEQKYFNKVDDTNDDGEITIIEDKIESTDDVEIANVLNVNNASDIQTSQTGYNVEDVNDREVTTVGDKMKRTGGIDLDGALHDNDTNYLQTSQTVHIVKHLNNDGQVTIVEDKVEPIGNNTEMGDMLNVNDLQTSHIVENLDDNRVVLNVEDKVEHTGGIEMNHAMNVNDANDVQTSQTTYDGEYLNNDGEITIVENKIESTGDVKIDDGLNVNTNDLQTMYHDEHLNDDVEVTIEDKTESTDVEIDNVLNVNNANDIQTSQTGYDVEDLNDREVTTVEDTMETTGGIELDDALNDNTDYLQTSQTAYIVEDLNNDDGITIVEDKMETTGSIEMDDTLNVNNANNLQTSHIVEDSYDDREVTIIQDKIESIGNIEIDDTLSVNNVNHLQTLHVVKDFYDDREVTILEDKVESTGDIEIDNALNINANNVQKSLVVEHLYGDKEVTVVKDKVESTGDIEIDNALNVNTNDFQTSHVVEDLYDDGEITVVEGKPESTHDIEIDNESNINDTNDLHTSQTMYVVEDLNDDGEVTIVDDKLECTGGIEVGDVLNNANDLRTSQTMYVAEMTSDTPNHSKNQEIEIYEDDTTEVIINTSNSSENNHIEAQNDATRENVTINNNQDNDKEQIERCTIIIPSRGVHGEYSSEAKSSYQTFEDDYLTNHAVSQNNTTFEEFDRENEIGSENESGYVDNMEQASNIQFTDTEVATHIQMSGSDVILNEERLTVVDEPNLTKISNETLVDEIVDLTAEESQVVLNSSLSTSHDKYKMGFDSSMNDFDDDDDLQDDNTLRREIDQIISRPETTVTKEEEVYDENDMCFEDFLKFDGNKNSKSNPFSVASEKVKSNNVTTDKNISPFSASYNLTNFDINSMPVIISGTDSTFEFPTANKTVRSVIQSNRSSKFVPLLSGEPRASQRGIIRRGRGGRIKSFDTTATVTMNNPNETVSLIGPSTKLLVSQSKDMTKGMDKITFVKNVQPSQQNQPVVATVGRIRQTMPSNYVTVRDSKTGLQKKFLLTPDQQNPKGKLAAVNQPKIVSCLTSMLGSAPETNLRSNISQNVNVIRRNVALVPSEKKLLSSGQIVLTAASPQSVTKPSRFIIGGTSNANVVIRTDGTNIKSNRNIVSISDRPGVIQARNLSSGSVVVQVPTQSAVTYKSLSQGIVQVKNTKTVVSSSFPNASTIFRHTVSSTGNRPHVKSVTSSPISQCSTTYSNVVFVQKSKPQQFSNLSSSKSHLPTNVVSASSDPEIMFLTMDDAKALQDSAISQQSVIIKSGENDFNNLYCTTDNTQMIDIPYSVVNVEPVKTTKEDILAKALENTNVLQSDMYLSDSSDNATDVLNTYDTKMTNFTLHQTIMTPLEMSSSTMSSQPYQNL